MNGILRRPWPWLVLLAVCAYAAALAGDYVFDDVHSIAANPSLHSPVDWWKLCSDPSAFSGGSSRMFRPVLLLSFAANLAVSPEPWALKAGNVLLHALIAWLGHGWLRRLGVARAPAFAALAVFAVHPLASEAINLVSARSEQLLVLGLLLALRGHLRWCRRAGPGPLLAVLGGTLLACGSKETGALLPVLLAVQHAAVHRGRWTWRTFGRACAVLLPVAVCVVGYLVLRKLLLGQATAALLDRAGGDPLSGHGRTLVTQLATMGLLLPRALLQTVVPAGLSFDPPVDFRTSLADPLVLAGWGGVLGLTLAALWPGRGARARRAAVALAWTCALPWILVPLNMPLAEHRLYGPLLGVLGAVAAALPRSWFARASAPARSGAWRTPAFVGLLSVFACLAVGRSLDYRDERQLWQHELASRPTSWRAWWGLGTATLRTGDAPAAVEPLANAHALYPGHVDVLRNYTEALLGLPAGKAQPERALRAATELTEVAPVDPWARALLAEAHLLVGAANGDRAQFEAAERAALSCLEVGEAKGLVYRLAARARRGLGDLPGALAHLDESLAKGIDPVSVRLDRAAVLRDLGRPADAHRELLRAQRQAPFDPAVQAALQLAAPGH